jgi:hypothetical protein
MARDSKIWRILFYGAGGLWLVLEALMTLTPDQAAAIWLTPMAMTRLSVILLLLTIVGGKLGLSPLRAKDDPAGAGVGNIAPRVLPAFLAIVLGLGMWLPACSPKQMQVARGADVGVYTALAAVQDAENALYAAGQITQPQHQAINKKLVPALQAGRDFNHVMMTWKPGMPAPAELVPITQRLGDLTRDLSQYLSGATRDGLLAKVAVVEQAILGALAGVSTGG